jgi:hypothetical protein
MLASAPALTGQPPRTWFVACFGKACCGVAAANVTPGVYTLRLTDKGRRRLANAEGVVGDIDAALTEALPPARREPFLEALSTIVIRHYANLPNRDVSPCAR